MTPEEDARRLEILQNRMLGLVLNTQAAIDRGEPEFIKRRNAAEEFGHGRQMAPHDKGLHRIKKWREVEMAWNAYFLTRPGTDEARAAWVAANSAGTRICLSYMRGMIKGGLGGDFMDAEVEYV